MLKIDDRTYFKRNIAFAWIEKDTSPFAMPWALNIHSVGSHRSPYYHQFDSMGEIESAVQQLIAEPKNFFDAPDQAFSEFLRKKDQVLIEVAFTYASLVRAAEPRFRGFINPNYIDVFYGVSRFESSSGPTFYVGLPHHIWDGGIYIDANPDLFKRLGVTTESSVPTGVRTPAEIP